MKAKKTKKNRIKRAAGPCTKVPGCTRKAAVGRGGTKDTCPMHYRRFKRTGSYGSADPEIGAGKKPVKIYVPPELAERLRAIAKKISTSVSEWGEGVLDREAAATLKLKPTKNPEPTASAPA